MAIFDEFIRVQVHPLLRGGEALIGACYAMQITDRVPLGTPVAFDTWLLAFAPTRMFLIQTPARADGLFGFKRVLEPRALQVVEVPFDHVDVVHLKKTMGVGLGDHKVLDVYFHGPLRPQGIAMLATTAQSDVTDKREEPCGRCVVLMIPPSCEGLDGQAASWSQFPAWFEERVRTRAFPQSEATRAALAAAEAERASLASAAAATRAARVAWWAQNRLRVVGTVALILSLGFFGFSANYFSKYLRDSGNAAEDSGGGWQRLAQNSLEKSFGNAFVGVLSLSVGVMLLRRRRV